jgi:hypothetical protein
MVPGYDLSSLASIFIIMDRSKPVMLTHLVEKDDELHGKLTSFQCYQAAVPERLLITLKAIREWFAAFAITVYL